MALQASRAAVGALKGDGTARPVSSGKPVPSRQERTQFQRVVNLSSKLMFRCGAAGPLQSSPVSLSCLDDWSHNNPIGTGTLVVRIQ